MSLCIYIVTPAKAGVQGNSSVAHPRHPRFRGGDNSSKAASTKPCLGWTVRRTADLRLLLLALAAAIAPPAAADQDCTAAGIAADAEGIPGRLRCQELRRGRIGHRSAVARVHRRQGGRARARGIRHERFRARRPPHRRRRGMSRPARGRCPRPHPQQRRHGHPAAAPAAGDPLQLQAMSRLLPGQPAGRDVRGDQGRRTAGPTRHRRLSRSALSVRRPRLAQPGAPESRGDRRLPRPSPAARRPASSFDDRRAAPIPAQACPRAVLAQQSRQRRYHRSGRRCRAPASSRTRASVAASIDAGDRRQRPHRSRAAPTTRPKTASPATAQTSQDIFLLHATDLALTHQLPQAQE